MHRRRFGKYVGFGCKVEQLDCGAEEEAEEGCAIEAWLAHRSSSSVVQRTPYSTVKPTQRRLSHQTLGEARQVAAVVPCAVASLVHQYHPPRVPAPNRHRSPWCGGYSTVRRLKRMPHRSYSDGLIRLRRFASSQESEDESCSKGVSQLPGRCRRRLVTTAASGTLFSRHAKRIRWALWFKSEDILLMRSCIAKRPQFRRVAHNTFL